jgi:hypothetical protein
MKLGLLHRYIKSDMPLAATIKLYSDSVPNEIRRRLLRLHRALAPSSVGLAASVPAHPGTAAVLVDELDAGTGAANTIDIEVRGRRCSGATQNLNSQHRLVIAKNFVGPMHVRQR